jgi:hypothetical protein
MWMLTVYGSGGQEGVNLLELKKASVILILPHDPRIPRLAFDASVDVFQVSCG